MLVAEAELFREQIGSPQWGLLEEALQRPLPGDDEAPGAKMFWVADNLGEIGEGLRVAGLPFGFADVYSGLSFAIYERISQYRTAGDLTTNAVRFQNMYRGEQLAVVRYLQGDDRSLHTVSLPWQIALLSPALLVDDVPEGLQAGMGVNTHIKSKDLVNTLRVSDPSDDYYGDYHVEVKYDINKTIDRMAPHMVPGTTASRLATVAVMKALIVHGRKQAWNDFQAAKKMTEDEVDELQQRRDRKAANFNKRYISAGGALLKLGVRIEQLAKHDQDNDQDLEAA